VRQGAPPVRPDLLAALGMEGVPLTTGAVCVYHAMVPAAVAALEGSGVPVAAVSTGFPAGLTPVETRLAEIRASVAAGAEEIDVVIHRTRRSPATGRRCTTSSAPSARPAARRTSR
jgi:deoxyribose-phosphate aldolase